MCEYELQQNEINKVDCKVRLFNKISNAKVLLSDVLYDKISNDKMPVLCPLVYAVFFQPNHM